MHVLSELLRVRLVVWSSSVFVSFFVVFLFGLVGAAAAINVIPSALCRIMNMQHELSAETILVKTLSQLPSWAGGRLFV